MIYSKDSEENKRQRIKLILEANNNDELKVALIRKCREDVLFFFNIFLWSFKPKAVGSEGEPDNPNIPFITYEFQDEYIKNIIWCIENQRDNITEKSREMGFSWMILGIAVWGLLFKSRSGLIGSYKEDYVDSKGNMDSSFERLRYMLDKLPSWMKPSDLLSKYMSISSKELMCEIGGDAGENFGTGGRRKYIFLDEFALWRTADIAFRKTKDVTNCRIIGGTPFGKINIYGKIMTNHPDYAHLLIQKYRLHWSLHPLKTKEWYELQKQTRTKLDLAQELDISYDNSVEGAVYKDFETLVTFKDIEYNNSWKLYTSWDFGRDANCVIIWAKDFIYDKLYTLRSVKRVGRHIGKFGAFIKGKPTLGHEYDKKDLEEIEEISKFANLYAGHFGDPYNGDSLQTNSTKTIKDILSELGIYLKLKTGSTVQTRIRATTLSLNKISIDYKNNIDLIESMRQSHYPRIKEGSQTTREQLNPVHDENSHYRTAFEYFIDNEPQILKLDKYKEKTFFNKITGKMQTIKYNL